MIAWWIGLALFALGGAVGFAAAAVLASGKCDDCIPGHVSPYSEGYDNGWKDSAYFYMDWKGE